MSDSDIAAKGVLVKYKDNNVYHYMHRGPKGDIIGKPERIGALMFTPPQAKAFINHMLKINFPFMCGPEVVK